MTHPELSPKGEITVLSGPTTFALELQRANEAMLREAIIWAERAKQIVVGDPSAYAGANGMLREVATFAKRIEADRKEKKAPILQAGKDLDAQYTEAERELKEARAHLETTTRDYEREENRKRQEAAQRAAELAERERQRLEKLADRAAERGDTKRANEYEERAEYLAEAPVAMVRPLDKAEGISTRDNWVYEITDPTLIPREYLVPDAAKIGRYVKLMKVDAKIPGVRIWNAETTAVRSLE